ncbi:DUF2956 domain-containing protein [Vibrio sp. 10N.261.55.A7]|uniref:DUF2956 domain-containing protein n=1 Tax=Vibrio sp. 10N.261.55.A7 TaxID=1880851 RepID=UPI000C82B79D|nr:DUF2956 domain-containing protein [Vibrio sp. 10N.261.55.A7]PMK04993.1 hypothetical protein BCU12_15625 [Vibrio sp. 10N.261.55.A7]
MKNTTTPSEETQQQAMKIAKATQKQGQNKEQTKLIAQGIEKGIALYKKQQKERNRQADKVRKKAQKQKESVQSANETQADSPPPVEKTTKGSMLPWMLLIVSWAGFITYITQQ